MPVQTEAPIRLSAAAGRVDSSAIRDLLDVVDRADVISLAGGLPAPETFPADAIAGAVGSLLHADPAALQYSTTAGFAALRELVAEEQRVDPGQVVITHGSQQALDLTARALLDPGDTVALADPGYVGAIQAFRLAGARLQAVPSDGDGFRVDDFEAALGRGARPALVYVVPNFDNPTGVTLSMERRQRLAALADRYGFVIVEDDPYAALRWRGADLQSIATFSDRVVGIRTVSKLLCPGLRVGFVISPPALADAMVLLKQALDLHTSTLAQRAVHELLATPGFVAAQVRRLRPLYRTRAEALTGALRAHLGPQFEFHEPSGGMFVWGRFVGDLDSRALLPRAIDHGVAFVPGHAFAVVAEHRSAMRLSFATVEPDQLREGVRRLAAAVPALLAAR